MKKQKLFKNIKGTRYYVSQSGVVLSIFWSKCYKKVMYKEIKIMYKGQLTLYIKGVKKNYQLSTLVKELFIPQ